MPGCQKAAEVRKIRKKFRKGRKIVEKAHFFFQGKNKSSSKTRRKCPPEENAQHPHFKFPPFRQKGLPDEFFCFFEKNRDLKFYFEFSEFIGMREK